MIEPERRLAHKVKHDVRSMLGSHLETARDVRGYQFLVILTVGAVNLFITRVVHRQVVTYTAANKRLLDSPAQHR